MTKRPFKINYLSAFRVITEEGNLTSAAKRLNCSQGQLSRLIIAMEEQCDNLLFKRSSRGLKLTTSGYSFLSAVNNYIASHENFLRTIDQMRNNPSEQRITIAAPPGFIQFISSNIVQHLAKKYPSIPISLTTLLAGDIHNYDSSLTESDIILSYLPSELPSAINRRFSIEMGFYASPYIKNQLHGIHPEDLPNVPCITIDNFGLRTNEWAYLTHNGTNESLSFTGKYHCHDIFSAIIMAINHLGVINIPVIIAKKYVATEELAELSCCKGIVKDYFIINTKQSKACKNTNLIINGLIAEGKKYITPHE